jgi:hypothetical protein
LKCRPDLRANAPNLPGDPSDCDGPAVDSAIIDEIHRFIKRRDIAGLAGPLESIGGSFRCTPFPPQLFPDFNWEAPGHPLDRLFL